MRREHFKNSFGKAALKATRHEATPAADEVRTGSKLVVTAEWTSADAATPQTATPEECGLAAAHVELWRRCAASTQPLLILGDDTSIGCRRGSRRPRARTSCCARPHMSGLPLRAPSIDYYRRIPVPSNRV